MRFSRPYCHREVGLSEAICAGLVGVQRVNEMVSRLKQLLDYTAKMQTSLIGFEACSASHFLGGALHKQGHDVRLISAQFVKPFVKSNKNDFVEAQEAPSIHE